MLAGVAAAFTGIGFVIARKVTAPVGPRRFDLIVRGVDVSDGRTLVVLDRTEQTATPGRFNLILETGEWIRLGEEVRPVGEETVEREALGDTAALRVGVRASWSGMYFRTPAHAGLEATEVAVPTPVGPAPAWRIEPTSDTAADVWAIHIHGLGGTRAGTLRGVQVAARAGLVSLVVSYRNDGEGPTVGSRRSTLGATEADDVEAAVRFAIEHGARQMVLFGWSMGGAIALHLAARPGVRDRIAGLVLESPVLDWVETLKENCTRAGLPGWFGALALPWLDSPQLARVVGLGGAVRTRRFDWMDRGSHIQIPVLVLHGTRDRSAPVELGRRLRANAVAHVRLEEFDADHTMTWNVDASGWRAHVTRWITTLRLTEAMG
ncbi:alpha/beta fold hydrolase [Agromyces sp. CFH 90414]|uniref:Alpha/beta fold hydrolase n=1 Tax=Agromyces agglutinans TaxID=2662258 RepID=A0A6I2F8T9_9MICO|nr:alpha/beta fold hydrolase [Agromyces agglutinans]MRG58786.1 alpha/beta fold hydrolase [Agromyces agglutinans]